MNHLQSTFHHRPIQILFQRIFEARYVILDEISKLGELIFPVRNGSEFAGLEPCSKICMDLVLKQRWMGELMLCYPFKKIEKHASNESVFHHLFIRDLEHWHVEYREICPYPIDFLQWCILKFRLIHLVGGGGLWNKLYTDLSHGFAGEVTRIST